MIDPGDGWKFRNHLHDYGLYEDQIVEHMIIGHQALRRAFSTKLQEDEKALAAVKSQIEVSAQVEHWGWPGLYQYEMVSGHHCLYHEYIEGEPLDKRIARREFAEPKVWADQALNLVKLCIDFEQLGIAFDRVRPENIRAAGRLFRVAERWPIGLPRDESSLWIDRLKNTKAGGVYVAEGPYPMRFGLLRLKDILFYMASGQTNRTVGEMIDFVRQHERQTGQKAFSILQLEPEVEQILFRLHNQEDPKAITHLEELKWNLLKLCPLRMMAFTSTVEGEEPEYPRGGMRAAAAEGAAPAPRRVAAPEPEPEEVKRPVESATPAPASRASSADIGGVPMVGHDKADEDAEEDRSYLYPAPPSSPAVPTPARHAKVGTAPSLPPPGRGRRMPGAASLLLRFLFVLLVLAGLGLGGYVGYVLFLQAPNQPPTAAFEPVPEQIRLLQTITLDASGSTDPDGDSLSYTWSILDLNTRDYRFRPNLSRDAVFTELQVFVTGTFTIELKVFDGQSFSEPVTQTIQVTPP